MNASLFPPVEPSRSGWLPVGDGHEIHWEMVGSGAGEPAVVLHGVIVDIEALRAHLGVERWVVVGSSWGVTLGLAYAQRYPERVSRHRR